MRVGRGSGCRVSLKLRMLGVAGVVEKLAKPRVKLGVGKGVICGPMASRAW